MHLHFWKSTCSNSPINERQTDREREREKKTDKERSRHREKKTNTVIPNLSSTEILAFFFMSALSTSFAAPGLFSSLFSPKRQKTVDPFNQQQRPTTPNNPTTLQAINKW